MDPNMHSKSLQRPLIELTHVESIFAHFGGRFLINFGLQNRSKNGSKKSSILGCIFGPIFAEIWLQVGPRRRRHSRKIGVLGGALGGQETLLSSVVPLGSVLGALHRIWNNFGTILAPKMAPKSDLGRIWAPKKQNLAPKMVPKLTKESKKWHLIRHHFSN